MELIHKFQNADGEEAGSHGSSAFDSDPLAFETSVDIPYEYDDQEEESKI
jgi:hypothetical protein